MKPRLAASVLLLSTVLATCLATAAESEIKPTQNLVVEGIPAIPAKLGQELRRYTEARAAGFAGWHPTKLEMLISTRFGNTVQLHQVSAPLGMRRQMTFFEEPVAGGGIDPVKGDFFLFTRDQGGSEFAQLYRYDFADAGVTLLSDGGRSQNGNVSWSTKGDRIAYASTRRNGADRDIYVMDPRDPKTDRCVLQVKGGGWGIEDRSSDDRQLLIEEEISINETHLWLLDLDSGKLSEFTPRSEKDVAYSSAAFTPDGKGVYLTTDKDSEFKRLAYRSLATGETRFLAGDLKGDIEAFSLSWDGKRLAFELNAEGQSRIFLMDTATGAYAPVPGLPTGVIGLSSWHRDNRHLALVLNTAKSTSDVFVFDADAGSLVRWTENELGGIAAATLKESELIKWKSFDGLEISGFYFKASDKFTGKRPVIINIHGGPESQALPVFQGRNNYYMNELGVAMIYPNVRGSAGFGKTYLTLDNGFKREDSVKDIGALLDWIAQRPELDSSRVMITGGSYGGFMTLACAVAYNDRIRCSLDVVGISNFVTFLENTESYRRDLRRVEYGDERDPAMRAFMLKIAPALNASKITKPLFVVQGTNDPRVPRTEAIQMVETVRKNGSPVWYLEAKDEGHGFRKKGNADFQFYATILFVKQFLLN